MPDFSPAAVAASADKRLKRLQSDYIDLFQLRNPPPEALRAGALPAEMSRKFRAWAEKNKQMHAERVPIGIKAAMRAIYPCQ